MFYYNGELFDSFFDVENSLSNFFGNKRFDDLSTENVFFGLSKLLEGCIF